jgi:hypothetical protein
MNVLRLLKRGDGASYVEDIERAAGKASTSSSPTKEPAETFTPLSTPTKRRRPAPSLVLSPSGPSYTGREPTPSKAKGKARAVTETADNGDETMSSDDPVEMETESIHPSKRTRRYAPALIIQSPTKSDTFAAVDSISECPKTLVFKNVHTIESFSVSDLVLLFLSFGVFVFKRFS